MASVEQVTFCRICEPCCGLVATVRDGQLEALRPDRDHPITAGYSCPKGIESVHMQNDPDRVLHPLRRHEDGTFRRVSWETALDEIAERMARIRDEHGGGSIGAYIGNPSAFSHSHSAWTEGFVKGLGSRHIYSPVSQDGGSRFVASALLYGNPVEVPMPDLERTSFLLIIGANPLVSHGSLVIAGHMRPKLHDIVARGGRVVVIDPRRTETAKAFEHIAIRPDTDAWLLLGVLHVLFAEGLVDHEAVATQSRGVELIRDAAARWTPEEVADRTGIAADEVRALARDLARAPSAAIYGRTGSCLGTFGTLVNFLIDTLNLVTGNLDRPGGAVFSRPPIDFAGMALRSGAASYDTYRSRIGDLPEVLGHLPAALIAQEIETPGQGQLRALIVSAGNPVLTVPGGDTLSAALRRLDLQVGIDLYLNETHRTAHYVLPATSFLEREDLPLALLNFRLTPFAQWTDAVVAPRGEAREDWRIMDDLGRRLGFAPFLGSTFAKLGAGRRARLTRTVLNLLTRPLKPRRFVDFLLRTGRDGDLFGLRRGGLSVAKLRANPHGIVLAPHVETGVLGKRVAHEDRKVLLAPPQIRAELDRLARVPNGDPRYSLRLIGRRELWSHNSWMHNNPRFADPKRGQRALVNPADAASAGIADGAVARIVSPSGAIDVPVALTEDVMRGTVAVPQGWGHSDAGWRVANQAGGANVNVLASTRPEHLELLAGMAHLNGIPVRLELPE